jgi:hypothetical protein
MKKYRVSLTRDYTVEIKAENKAEAKECAEFFVSGGLDASTEKNREQYNFEIERIKPIINNAFEVELSTGVWSGAGRMATLIDYQNVGLFVISNDSKKYNQVINSFSEYENRYKFIANELIDELYSAELGLKELRKEIGL